MNTINFVTVLFFLLLPFLTSATETTISPSDPLLLLSGRWLPSSSLSSSSSEEEYLQADWPCATVRFTFQSLSPNSSVQVLWKGLRLRLNVSVWNDELEIISTHLENGMTIPHSSPPTSSVIEFPDVGTYSVTIKKLTCAASYGMGIGSVILEESWFSFYGIGYQNQGKIITTKDNKRKKIQFIGASDTQGYCVDGTPEDDANPSTYLAGYKYDNCDMAYTGLLASRFSAEYQLQGIAGIGLTQNANSAHPAGMGTLPMPDLFNRTLQMNPSHIWDFTQWQPDMVVISLGGNDYNHQGGNIPSNETFTEAMESFLLTLFKYSSPNTVIVNICGMGDPHEAEVDADNNRCSPCPHVNDGTNNFIMKYPDMGQRLHYVFIPCDGSVVTGVGDIGCVGHKNRVGQAEVADFLEPRLRAIMNWQ